MQCGVWKRGTRSAGLHVTHCMVDALMKRSQPECMFVSWDLGLIRRHSAEVGQSSMCTDPDCKGHGDR